jgi:caffeoyl-CoA O-methyltransferase
MAKLASALIICLVLGAIGFPTNKPEEQNRDKFQALDRQVQQFMESRRGSWRDLNVPEVDGKALYDIVLQHGYKNALEIGTSTGYSGIWISWALAKTGGKLVTIELDKYRYDEALANFRAAGLSKYVDARLGNAHDLVPAWICRDPMVLPSATKRQGIDFLTTKHTKENFRVFRG